MEIGAQFGFGLELASDLWIPGAVAPAPDSKAPALRIAIAAAQSNSPDARFDREGEAIVYSHPAGSFRCHPDRIEIAPSEPADLEDLAVLLIANALPAVLWLRGAFVLHAACVRLPDGLTIAIAGPSGAGKSRLAASLVEAGAELIGDDSLALMVSGDDVLAAGLPGGWFSRSEEGSPRQFVSIPGEATSGMARLDVLAILDGEQLAVGGHSPITAFELLMQNRHRPQVPLLLGLQRQVLAHAVQIARRLPLVGLGACRGSIEDLAATRTALGHLARSVRYARPPGLMGSAGE